MGPQELGFVGLAGSGLGTVLSLPMVWPAARRSADVRLLGASILLLAVIAALISARLTGLVPPTPSVEHAINLLGLVAMPLLVLYTRYATELPISFDSARWAFAPAAAYVVVVVAKDALGFGSRVPFSWMLPVVLGFTGITALTLLSRRERRSSLVPAEWVLAFVVLVNVAQIVRMEFGSIAFVRAVVPIVLSLGFVAIAAFAVWRSAAENCASTVGPRYERSGLDSDVARNLRHKIELALTRDRLFAKPDLTLAQLASAVGATPHQISEVLNRYARVSFNDLINRRRVEDVKTQLLDPESERFTIEGIGASAGFGSRSALYAAFRRFEGTTPTAFRISHRQSRSEG